MKTFLLAMVIVNTFALDTEGKEGVIEGQLGMGFPTSPLSIPIPKPPIP